MAATVPSAKRDFPALFPYGEHTLTMADLRTRCVAPFPKSGRRDALMLALEALVDSLAALGIPGEIWVNGSFCTKKEDPGDIDMVLRTTYDFLDGVASPKQLAA